MPTLVDLQKDMTALSLKAHAVVEDDKLTSAEKREQLDQIDPEIKSLSEKIADLRYLNDKRAEYKGLASAGDAPPDPDPDGGDNGDGDPAVTARIGTKSIGELVTDSDGYKSVLQGVRAGGKFASGPIELKATLLESGLTSANVIAQDRQPGILPILFRRLTVADLMPNGTTNGNTVRYAKESTATNAAAAVAEGDPKPESTLNFTIVDEPVRKIATWLKVSDEMLEDLAQAQSYINGRLVLFVRLAEEAALLTGAGSPSLTGILQRSGLTIAQAKGGDSIAVAVHKEVTKIRVASFLDPDAVVFHPNDWEAARLEQDLNGQFYGGGPFTGPYGVNGVAGDSYWGLRVVSTTAETENTALIGAFATAAQVFRRSGITVDMTNSDGTDFQNNLTTIRAEERLALAVYRPSAFGTVTGV